MDDQKQKYNIGLIGLGEVAGVHLTAYDSVENIYVVAGTDISEERMTQRSHKWNFAGYTDYHVMIKNHSLDAIIVCVPCRYHCEVVENIAHYKIPILVEKPLAGSVTEGKAMIEICKTHGTPLGYGASYRWLPAVIKAKEMIDQGLLGDISLITERCVGGFGKENYPDLGPQHYKPGLPGGVGMGVLDHGIHIIDLFRWLMNTEVTSVFGQGNISGQPPITEHVTMNAENGAVGQLIYNQISFRSDLESEGLFSWGGSWRADGALTIDGGWEPYPGSIRVHGDRGALRIFHYANKLFHFDQDGAHPIKIMDKPMPANFSMQLEAFLASVQTNSLPSVSAEEGVKALEVIEGIYESQLHKKLINLK